MTETSERDEYSEGIERMIRSSTHMLLGGRATQKNLASSLTELGYTAQETAYIVEQSIIRVGRVSEFQRQTNKVSDGQFIRLGFLILSLGVILLGIFGPPIHGRGQGMLTIFILLGIGAIAFGFWGRIKDKFNKIRNR